MVSHAVQSFFEHSFTKSVNVSCTLPPLSVLQETCPAGKSFQSRKVVLDRDLLCLFKFYPNGVEAKLQQDEHKDDGTDETKADETAIGLFWWLQITNKKQFQDLDANDRNREVDVTFSFKQGHKKIGKPLSSTIKLNRIFSSKGTSGGRGWDPLSGYVLDPSVPIWVQMKLVIRGTLSTTTMQQISDREIFVQQLRQLYDYSLQYGDVQLKLVSSYKTGQQEEQEPEIEFYNSADGDEDEDAKYESANGIDDEPKDNIYIRANGPVLRSASPVFDRILSANMVEKEDKIIEIQTKSEKDVKDMLYFLCTHELRPDCNLLSLLQFGHYYEIKPLFNACRVGLLKILRMYEHESEKDQVQKREQVVLSDGEAMMGLGIAIWFQIHRLFTLYKVSIDDGYGEVLSFAQTHIVELMQHPQFEELEYGTKLSLIKFSESQGTWQKLELQKDSALL